MRRVLFDTLPAAAGECPGVGSSFVDTGLNNPSTLGQLPAAASGTLLAEGIQPQLPVPSRVEVPMLPRGSTKEARGAQYFREIAASQHNSSARSLPARPKAHRLGTVAKPWTPDQLPICSRDIAPEKCPYIVKDGKLVRKDELEKAAAAANQEQDPLDDDDDDGDDLLEDGIGGALVSGAMLLPVAFPSSATELAAPLQVSGPTPRSPHMQLSSHCVAPNMRLRRQQQEANRSFL